MFFCLFLNLLSLFLKQEIIEFTIYPRVFLKDYSAILKYLKLPGDTYDGLFFVRLLEKPQKVCKL